MRLTMTACFLGLLLLPTLANAQTYASTSRSVILPAEVSWRHYENVADGPCGCVTSVRTDCYDDHCPCCGCNPACWLHRVGRMLDCLLPCNVCCGFGHGCVLGGGCGCGTGCGTCCGSSCGLFSKSCCAPSCTTTCEPSCTCPPSCTTCVLPDGPPTPKASDPFQDDPVQPRQDPQASPTSSKRGTEIRWNPLLKTPSTVQKPREPLNEARALPAKTVSPTGKGLLHALAARKAKPQPAAVAQIPATAPAHQSVLLRTSHASEVTAAKPAPRSAEIVAAPIPAEPVAPPQRLTAPAPQPVMEQFVAAPRVFAPPPLPRSAASKTVVQPTVVQASAAVATPAPIVIKSVPVPTDVEIPHNPLR